MNASSRNEPEGKSVTDPDGRPRPILSGGGADVGLVSMKEVGTAPIVDDDGCAGGLDSAGEVVEAGEGLLDLRGTPGLLGLLGLELGRLIALLAAVSCFVGDMLLEEAAADPADIVRVVTRVLVTYPVTTTSVGAPKTVKAVPSRKGSKIVL